MDDNLEKILEQVRDNTWAAEQRAREYEPSRMIVRQSTSPRA
jgi:hypothetical protein